MTARPLPFCSLKIKLVVLEETVLRARRKRGESSLPIIAAARDQRAMRPPLSFTSHSFPLEERQGWRRIQPGNPALFLEETESDRCIRKQRWSEKETAC